MHHPVGGRDCPRSLDEFLAWFRTDELCLDYLDWVRWPDGFVCPQCRHEGYWKRSDGRFECRGCGARTTVTSGTIFDRTRTPLTVWFMAVWLFATGKDGIAALSLKRTLSVGSYQTMWAALHRLRKALVRPGRERLTGVVEVDESYIGGVEPGLQGGRARGKKALVAIAVEMRGERLGRCRMQVVPDASGDTLQGFVKDHVEPGSTVVTDGWHSYPGLTKLGYTHEARNQSAAKGRGEDPGELLKGVHRVASLAKRWLLGTHQGAVENSHLPAYLNEFVFRFNRRNSRSRGMVFFRALQLAVMHEPVRYEDLIVERRPRKVPPNAPAMRGSPPSLDRPTADRPWRRGATPQGAPPEPGIHAG